MIVRIHFTHADGTDDSFVISGDTVEVIRDVAQEQLAVRNIDSGNIQSNCWSEVLA